eukprot:3562482-Rhodomonas_salina.1
MAGECSAGFCVLSSSHSSTGSSAPRGARRSNTSSTSRDTAGKVVSTPARSRYSEKPTASSAGVFTAARRMAVESWNQESGPRRQSPPSKRAVALRHSTSQTPSPICCALQPTAGYAVPSALHCVSQAGDNALPEPHWHGPAHSSCTHPKESGRTKGAHASVEGSARAGWRQP